MLDLFHHTIDTGLGFPRIADFLSAAALPDVPRVIPRITNVATKIVCVMNSGSQLLELSSVYQMSQVSIGIIHSGPECQGVLSMSLSSLSLSSLGSDVCSQELKVRTVKFRCNKFSSVVFLSLLFCLFQV